MQSMIVVGNNYGLGGSAKAGVRGDVQNDDIGLAMARHIGLRVAEVAGKISAREECES